MNYHYLNYLRGNFLSIGFKLSTSIRSIDLSYFDPIDVRNLIMLIIIWVKISTAIFMLTK